MENEAKASADRIVTLAVLFSYIFPTLWLFLRFESQLKEFYQYFFIFVGPVLCTIFLCFSFLYRKYWKPFFDTDKLVCLFLVHSMLRSWVLAACDINQMRFFLVLITYDFLMFVLLHEYIRCYERIHFVSKKEK